MQSDVSFVSVSEWAILTLESSNLTDDVGVLEDRSSHDFVPLHTFPHNVLNVTCANPGLFAESVEPFNSNMKDGSSQIDDSQITLRQLLFDMLKWVYVLFQARLF